MPISPLSGLGELGSRQRSLSLVYSAQAAQVRVFATTVRAAELVAEVNAAKLSAAASFSAVGTRVASFAEALQQEVYVERVVFLPPVGRASVDAVPSGLARRLRLCGCASVRACVRVQAARGFLQGVRGTHARRSDAPIESSCTTGTRRSRGPRCLGQHDSLGLRGRREAQQMMASRKDVKDLLMPYDQSHIVADLRRCGRMEFGGRSARARFQKFLH